MARLSFLWFPNIRSLGALSKNHYVAGKDHIVKVSVGDSSELFCSKFYINMIFFYCNTGDVSKVTEQIVDHFSLQVVPICKPNNWAANVRLLLQFHILIIFYFRFGFFDETAAYNTVDWFFDAVVDLILLMNHMAILAFHAHFSNLVF